MSDIARINLLLLGLVATIALTIVVHVPGNTAGGSASVLASPYCLSDPAELSLQGRAAYAEDLVSGTTLYAYNEDAQLPLASLTKIMTVLTARDTLSESDTVTATKDALSADGDSGLREGEKWGVQELTDLTLMASLNDGARALALAAAQKEGITLPQFIEKMNTKAKMIGLTQTYFLNETGLDVSQSNAGAYGSAHDVVKLLAYAVQHAPRFVEGSTEETKSFTSESGFVHKAQNTSPLPAGLPGVIASKTGFTDLAGGNLVVMFEPLPGRPVAAVVLGSTREGRDTDMKILAAAAQKTLRRELLCATPTP